MSSVIGGLIGSAGGGQIGSAVVNLQLESTKYKAQLAEAEASTKTKTGSMQKATSAFAAAGVAAYAAIAVGIVAFAKSSISAAIEQQQAQDKLANSIENSAKVTAAAIPAFDKQAQSIMRLTGAQDDDITSAQSMLVQMGATKNEVLTLTPLIEDLAAKQGVSLTTATKAVGKAINGTTGGLSRMGVIVDKTAAKTDAYGATLKALGVVQGFAAEKAKAEPWILLNAQFHEMQENVGKALLPVVKETSAAMAALVPIVSPGLSAAFATAAENIKPLVDTFVQLAGVIETVKASTEGQTTSTNASTGAWDTLNKVVIQGPIHALTTYNDIVLRHIGLTHGQTTAIAGVTQQTTDYTGAVTRNTLALRANRQQILADAGGLLGLSANLAQLATDEEAVNKARKQGKLDTAAGRDAERAYLTDKIAFIQALKTERDAMLKSHDSTQQIVDTLTKLGVAAGITRQEILKLIAGINGLPTRKDITIDVHHRGQPLGP